jgi:hypothetical protein
MWRLFGGFFITYKFPIIANVGNMQAFWGVVQMTISFELKRLKTLRVFNLLAPFATGGEKGLIAIVWRIFWDRNIKKN